MAQPHDQPERKKRKKISGERGEGGKIKTVQVTNIRGLHKIGVRSPAKHEIVLKMFLLKTGVAMLIWL